MSGFMFILLLVAVVASLSEEWNIVLLCLILGACTS